MKRVISFSLWGDNPTYNVGAIKNAELASIFYPDFDCWYYIHTDSVPTETVKKLEALSNTKIIHKEGDLNVCKPRTWRFEAIDEPEVEIMMSRDTDTRFLLREKLAVDAWLISGKLFHIMRDHPHHYISGMNIYAGMFGTRKIQNFSMKEQLVNFVQTGYNTYDQTFLHENVYPLIKNDLLVHSAFSFYPEEHSTHFPISYDIDFHFVGEYVYADETRSNYHTDELRRALNGNRNPNMINIITSFFVSKLSHSDISKRNGELIEALKRNVQSPYVEVIHLFVDDEASNNKLNELFTEHISSGKIVIASLGRGMPLYSDFFEYAINMVKGKICMVTNSDIYIHACETNIFNHLTNNMVYALTRHEWDLSCPLINHYRGSHDSFIFKSPLNVSYNEFKIPQNVWGSENVLLTKMYNEGVKILNPCKQIQIVHLHESAIREPDRQCIGGHSENIACLHHPPIIIPL